MVWGPWLKVYFMVVSSAQEGDLLQQTSENILLWLPLGNESTKNWRKKIEVKTDPKDSVGRKVQLIEAGKEVLPENRSRPEVTAE